MHTYVARALLLEASRFLARLYTKFDYAQSVTDASLYALHLAVPTRADLPETKHDKQHYGSREDSVYLQAAGVARRVLVIPIEAIVTTMRSVRRAEIRGAVQHSSIPGVDYMHDSVQKEAKEGRFEQGLYRANYSEAG